MRFLAIGFLCAAFFACRGEKPDGDEQQSGGDTEAQVPDQTVLEQPTSPGEPGNVTPEPEGTYSPPILVVPRRPGVGSPVVGGDGEPAPALCREEMCWKISSEKEIGHVLVSLPCPELIEDAELTDLSTGSKCGSHPPPEGDHDNCGLSLTGLKLDDLDATDVELCIRTSRPVSPDAVTIAFKSDGECVFVQTATDAQCGCQ